MSDLSVEERLNKLESQVTELMAALKPPKPGKYDWISTIGMFGNDPVMKEICDEASRSSSRSRKASSQISFITGSFPNIPMVLIQSYLPGFGGFSAAINSVTWDSSLLRRSSTDRSDMIAHFQ